MSDDIFRILVVATLPGAIAFPIICSRVRWWRDWVGRALMVKALGVAILLTISFMYQVFGPGYSFRDSLRLLGMLAVFFGIYAMCVNAAAAQRGVETTWSRSWRRLTRRVRRSARID